MEGNAAAVSASPERILFSSAGCGFFFCSGNLPTLKAGHKGHWRRGFGELLLNRAFGVKAAFPGFAWSGAVWSRHLARKLEAASVSCVLSATFHEEQNFCCLAASAAWTDFSGTKIPT